ncbi:MAG: hypothetical protein R3E39_13135 [Anaerolineae bacterium]
MTRYDSSGNYAPDSFSKYRRPRRPLSGWGLFIGVVLGIAGGLFYAWQVNPRIEFNTEPWQLNEADRANYMIGITLQYSYDGDLSTAVNRLLEMKLPGDPIQAVADTACRLATTGYVDNSSGVRAVRSLMVFYQLQGRKGCADTLVTLSDQLTPIPTIEAATPTLRPPATKTPTPVPAAQSSPTAQTVIIPTIRPQADFIVADVRTFCSTKFSGVIEVRVGDYNGNGIPATPIRVRWENSQSDFFTGLKPERGSDYADFQMDASKSYTVEVLGGSDPSQPLVAGPCTDPDNGQAAITSYRVTFRPA